MGMRRPGSTCSRSLVRLRRHETSTVVLLCHDYCSVARPQGSCLFLLLLAQLCANLPRADRAVEGRLIHARRAVRASQLAHELEGGRPNLFGACRWLEMCEGLDPPTHRCPP